MRSIILNRIFAASGALALCFSGLVVARESESLQARAFLRSYEEVPAVSSPALGEFRARFVPVPSDAGDAPTIGTIEWELSYSGLQGNVWREASIHLGQRGVNGHIVVLLCTDLQTVPGFVPLCPAEGTVSGVLTPDHVLNLAAAQGIEAGEFGKLLGAMRAGVTYVNVHTESFETGEIRGQIFTNRRRDLP